MITWAIISGLMMFAKTAAMFYTLRFLLSLAEAGLSPGVTLYLTYWFPPERRGKIIALFMTGVPISGVLGGPFSGWILHSMSGTHGLVGSVLAAGRSAACTRPSAIIIAMQGSTVNSTAR